MNIYKKIIHDQSFLLGKFFLPDVFPQLAIKKFLKMPNNILICDNNSGRLDIYLPKTPGLEKGNPFRENSK